MNNASTENERLYEKRVYANNGNSELLAFFPPSARSVLDVGCGAGDNARLIKAARPDRMIVGITLGEDERRLALSHTDVCLVCDIEKGIPRDIAHERYDVILLSHVLEHLRFPASILAELSELLCPNGVVLIALPNVLAWRQRVQFLRGRFEYASAGVMDESHLRFFTYDSVDRELFGTNAPLQIRKKTVTGAIPLWFLRRVLPDAAVRALDGFGCRIAPNLFGSQIIIVAQLTDALEQARRSADDA